KERIIDEIKCPENPKNNIAYCMITGNEAMIAADRAYYLQMQMNMACVAKYLGVPFESMKARFTSYCPLVNSPYKDIHHVMIDPDMEFYERLPKVIDRAERKLAEIVEAMTIGNVPNIQVNNEVSRTINKEIDTRPSIL